jgi:prepilin signal peptidase PulO-like enzyme (type II secretory pathway)
MFLFYLLSRGGMGAGVVKLSALLGAMLGFPLIISALAVGIAAGGILAGALLLLKLRGPSGAIPLGPMLLAGAASAMVTGTTVYDWYLVLFA